MDGSICEYSCDFDDVIDFCVGSFCSVRSQYPSLFFYFALFDHDAGSQSKTDGAQTVQG